MQNKEIKNKSTCNYCFQNMDYTVQLEKYQIPVCHKPECPAFGVLQISQEKIAETLGKEAEIDMLNKEVEKEYYGGFNYKPKTNKNDKPNKNKR